MSLTASLCPKCGTTNINTAHFCGACGQATHPNAATEQAYSTALPAGMNNAGMNNAARNGATTDSNWQEMAGLICGLLSMFMFGIFASAPGLYFSWTAISKAKAGGTSTRLGVVGIVLNCLGIVATVIVAVLVVLMIAMSMTPGGDPMMDGGMYGPSPYGY